MIRDRGSVYVALLYSQRTLTFGFMAGEKSDSGWLI